MASAALWRSIRLVSGKWSFRVILEKERERARAMVGFDFGVEILSRRPFAAKG